MSEDAKRLAAPEVEAQVLGAAIMANATVMQLLRNANCAAAWFSSSHHQDVWELLLDKAANMQPVDASLIVTYIREKYQWDASSMVNRMVSGVKELTNIHTWCKTLQEYSLRRELNAMMRSAMARLLGDIPASQVATIIRSDLNQLGTKSEHGGKSVLIDQLERDVDANTARDTLYLKSKLPWMAPVYGYYRGQPTVIGADPKTGKTTVLVQELVLQALAGIPAGLISIEMKAAQVYSLAACMVAGVDGFLIRTNQATETDKAAYKAALKAIKDAPFYVVDDARDTNSVMAAYFYLSLEKNCQVVGLDYFQIMTAPKEVEGKRSKREANRFDHLTDASNIMLAGCKELGNVLIVLSQLRKEGNMRGKPRDKSTSHPTQHDLDGTGALGRDCHMCVLISATDPDQGEEMPENVVRLRWNIECNRGGKTPVIDVDFWKAQQRFKEKGMGNAA